MASSLVGKTAIISGAYGGIGYAIADRFAREGASVVLLGRCPSKLGKSLARLTQDHGNLSSEGGLDKFRVRSCDVTKYEDWQTVMTDTSSIDILVNCAGLTQESLLLKTDNSTISDILATNLQGAIWGCKSVVKRMIKEKKAGCIINVSSLLAIKGHVGTSVYSASKAGLLGLTTSLALETGRFGIRVNAIVPGYIDTAMIQNLATQDLLRRIPLRRLGDPSEVADAAAFLAKNEYASNCILNLDGGLSAT